MASRTKTATSRKRTTEREVGINGSTPYFGQPFTVEKGGQAAGTPSGAPEHRRVGYAASSVIHRGTANEIRNKILASQKDHECLCGCGQVPSNDDALFMPGHDSKVRSMGKAVKEGRLERKQLSEGQDLYLEAGGML